MKRAQQQGYFLGLKAKMIMYWNLLLLTFQDNFQRAIEMFLDQKKLRQLNQQIRLTPNFKNIIIERMGYFQQNILLEDPDSIEELARKINKRQMQNSFKKSRKEDATYHRWVFGEKKVFCWALIFFSHFQNIAMEDLNRANRQEIYEIFLQKSPIFLHYEIIRLLNKKMGKKVHWIEAEVALFRQAAHNFTETNDWKAISFDLFVRSQGEIFRSPNQCREKWCNFLNPKLKRQSWSLEQDLKLFELVQRFGCRWAMISHEFGQSRTQHMVKNRVNLFYNNWKSKKKSSKKKGIFNSILSYLKKRMIRSKKGSKQDTSEGLLDRERGQYDCLQYYLSNQAEKSIINEAYQLPLHFVQCKEEKRTLDEEELNPLPQDKSQIDEVSDKLINKQQIQFFDLFCQELGKPFHQPQYDVELRVVEDEVARALGCHHFQRLPSQKFEQEQALEEESFCWL